MLKLRYSTTSPFVRKVSATIIECGLENHVENVLTNPFAPDTDLGQENPLGKVPALALENGEVLFDSPVICEYLDSLGTTPRLFPPDGVSRWAALRLQALGDGILDAAVGRVMESRRPEEQQSPVFKDRCKAAIERALNVLDRNSDQLSGGFQIGQLTVACALDYLDFRFSVENWREGHPNLEVWHQSVCERPSLKNTIPHD